MATKFLFWDLFTSVLLSLEFIERLTPARRTSLSLTTVRPGSAALVVGNSRLRWVD